MSDRLVQHQQPYGCEPETSSRLSVEIKAITWEKDSHGLFDYESKSCFHTKFKVRPSDLYIYRGPQSPFVTLANNEQQQQKCTGQNSSLISKLKLRHSQNHQSRVELLANPQPTPPKNQDKLPTEESGSGSTEDIHLIVRSLKNADGSSRGHLVETGQQLRLGRMVYNVIEQKTGSQVEYSETSVNSYFKNNTRFEESRSAEPGASCKICMDESDTNENFLLAPCRCIGSCQYVHLNCLRRWLDSKVKKEVVGGTLCYNFDKFECEICKAELPRYVMRNGLHELLKIDRPHGNYMIIEECSKQRKDLIVLHNIPSDGIKIGRGHQCDIRVTDISVSRLHAFIKLIGGKFVLFDNESKFGTLVKLRKDCPISFDKKAFQIGRTILTIKLKAKAICSEPMEVQQNK